MFKTSNFDSLCIYILLEKKIVRDNLCKNNAKQQMAFFAALHCLFVFPFIEHIVSPQSKDKFLGDGVISKTQEPPKGATKHAG